MTFIAGDEYRPVRSLKRSIIKRDALLEQLLLVVKIDSESEISPTNTPIFYARIRDLQTIFADFRLKQDNILDQLIAHDREVEFKKDHATIEVHFTEQYHLIKAMATQLLNAQIKASSINRQVM